MFDAALDQFGPHSRIIAPNGVESSYNYDRGGDIDELRIYDRMLSDDNIASWLRTRYRSRSRQSTATLPNPTGRKNGGSATAGIVLTMSLRFCQPQTQPSGRWRSMMPTI